MRKKNKTEAVGKKYYCVKCKQYTGTLNPQHVEKNGRHAIVGNCSVCGSKKHTFVKAHEAAGLLGKLLGLPSGELFPGSSNIPLLGALL